FEEYGKDWISKYSPTQEQLSQMARAALSFDYKPLISILLPVYNAPIEYLRECIESVFAQAYPYWELCIADDCSTNPRIREVLNEYEERDPRIKVVYRKSNGHISEASNSALELAQGDFLALLDHDDLLAPHALFEMAQAVIADRSVDVLYSNEDKIDAYGDRSSPTLKGGWSPSYFLSFMYIGHLSVYRTDLVRSVGGFRVGYEGSQDYDLALRISEKTNRIKHVPEILYHWRMHPESVALNLQAKPYAFTAARRALKEAMERREVKSADIEQTEYPGIYRPVISLSSKTNGALVLVGHTEDPSFVTFLEKTSGIKTRIISCPRDTAQSNAEALHLTIEQVLGEDRLDWICVLSRDLTPRSENWLSRLVENLGRKEIGLVGPKIINEQKQIVAAGCSLFGSLLSYDFAGVNATSPGYGARLVAQHDVTTVANLCYVIRVSDLKQSNVLSFAFQSEQSFVLAISLWLHANGKQTLWTPNCKFLYTGVTRESQVDLLKAYPADFEILKQNFGLDSYREVYYPPGLETPAANFRLAV
ncbi:MAG: glycosyltransferase, partial [Bdellovibrionales bacterium]|nr:glycosyltransferase [Bdellovibrionales bacterium]